jgi:hypothetical protein
MSFRFDRALLDGHTPITSRPTQIPATDPARAWGHSADHRGYEPVDSMIHYGQPGPFTEDVEDRIASAVHGMAKRVGR